MKCTNTQNLLIVSIITMIAYYLLVNKENENNINNSLNNSLNSNNNELIEIENSNNYNYSNNNTVVVNNTNVNTNLSNVNNDSNINNIVVQDNYVHIDVKLILEDDSIKNVYTKGTIPENLNNVLIYTIKNILSSIINVNTFNLKDLERIYEEIDKYNNRRYVVIFFVYNLNYFNSNKLVIDFVVNFDTNFIYLNTIKEFYNSYPNLINKYDSIIYNRAFLDNTTVEEDLDEILKEDYLKNYQYSYLSDTSLDFTNIFLFGSNKKYLKDLSTIYLPNTQTNLIENHLCDKYINGVWDKNGNLVKGNENCILHNSSSTQNIDVPDKYPHFGSVNHGNYHWLIDVARNNIIRQHGYAI